MTLRVRLVGCFILLLRCSILWVCGGDRQTVAPICRRASRSLRFLDFVLCSFLGRARRDTREVAELGNPSSMGVSVENMSAERRVVALAVTGSIAAYKA